MLCNREGGRERGREREREREREGGREREREGERERGRERGREREGGGGGGGERERGRERAKERERGREGERKKIILDIWLQTLHHTHLGGEKRKTGKTIALDTNDIPRKIQESLTFEKASLCMGNMYGRP